MLGYEWTIFLDIPRLNVILGLLSKKTATLRSTLTQDAVLNFVNQIATAHRLTRTEVDGEFANIHVTTVWLRVLA